LGISRDPRHAGRRHELVRDGFAMILDAQDDIEVVGQAADGVRVVELARTLTPDVVLMDVRMPVVNGIEATHHLRAAGLHRVAVLILTTFDLDEYVYEALRAGASGFLLKDVPRATLLHAVRTVATGEAMLAPAVTRRLIERFINQPPPTQDPPPELAELTERERDVLARLARGRANSEIARDLFLSEATVKTHVAHVLHKLGLRDRVQAVVYAYEAGLVSPGQP
jgi:DNA-binding NarL/FixJ family response regulator